ncbi:MAG: hypothetical protein ACRDZY_04340 [Acidimicrobiales bacterium]
MSSLLAASCIGCPSGSGHNVAALVLGVVVLVAGVVVFVFGGRANRMVGSAAGVILVILGLLLAYPQI